MLGLRSRLRHICRGRTEVGVVQVPNTFFADSRVALGSTRSWLDGGFSLLGSDSKSFLVKVTTNEISCSLFGQLRQTHLGMGNIPCV
jgi:hypothetical protein